MDLHVFFRNEVKPALGCTEPVAVALATARAACELGREPESIRLRLSMNIYKNGRDVGIPGTDGLRGNRVAAALGALAGDASKGLMVLEGVPAEAVARAKAMVDAGKVAVDVVDEAPGVYIEAELVAGADTVRATVADRHDNVLLVTKNGEELFRAEPSSSSAASGQPAYLEELKAMDMQGLWDLAGSLDAALEAFMLEGRDMNMAVAHMGMEGAWGLGVGQSIAAHGIAGGDLLTRVKGLTAAAADVRMSGAAMPVMSSAGSGNHGITAVVPVTAVAEDLGATPRQLAEALALSHLVTGYFKAYTGRLTPICGCSVAAGAGAAAGMTRIMGGTPAQAERAAASLIASLMGMLCDGAKGSCGLKVSAAAGEAYAAAAMAMDDCGVQQREGLVSTDLPTTAKALSSLCVHAFASMDRVMVDLLMQQPES
ncbi:MAG: serine dehydratase subunit alpha family protein [Desulfovibrionaceae bacterium]